MPVGISPKKIAANASYPSLMDDPIKTQNNCVAAKV